LRKKFNQTQKSLGRSDFGTAQTLLNIEKAAEPLFRESFASLCASFGRIAAKSTLAPRKVFFPTYTPPEKTI